MGILQSEDGPTRAFLRERHLLGRSRVCSLRLRHERASSEHAVLLWRDGVWWVRDLGSRNGTWLDGKRLESGAEHALLVGARLHFGARDCAWTLVSAEPPFAFAVAADARAVRAEGGLLELPGADDPVVVHQLGPDTWVADRRTGLARVDDQQTLEVGGRIWTVHLPGAVPRTQTAERLHVADLRLVFRVSRDEEHVHLIAETPSEDAIDLGARAHHYLLLTLARLRAEDAARPDLNRAEHGWVDKDRLSRLMGEDDNILHTHIHRARKQFARAGVDRAAELIERRLGAGALRIGAERFVFAAP